MRGCSKSSKTLWFAAAAVVLSGRRPAQAAYTFDNADSIITFTQTPDINNPTANTTKVAVPSASFPTIPVTASGLEINHTFSATNNASHAVSSTAAAGGAYELTKTNDMFVALTAGTGVSQNDSGGAFSGASQLDVNIFAEWALGSAFPPAGIFPGLSYQFPLGGIIGVGGTDHVILNLTFYQTPNAVSSSAFNPATATQVGTINSTNTYSNSTASPASFTALVSGDVLLNGGAGVVSGKHLIMTGDIYFKAKNQGSPSTFSLMQDSEVGAGAPASLVWNNSEGKGDGETWDVDGNLNWQTTGAAPVASVFDQSDNVTFNDSNNGRYLVSLGTTVTPTSITVDTTAVNYLFLGPGAISGITGITMTGGGVATLANTGTSTYTGVTAVQDGRLRINTPQALPVGAIVKLGDANNDNGTLDLSGNSVTVSSLTAVGNGINIVGNSNGDSGSSTLNYAGGISTFSGSIVDGLALGSTGGPMALSVTSGTLILTGSSSYTGGTTLKGGLLAIASDGAIGNGAGGVTFAGGTLQLNNYASFLSFANGASLGAQAGTGSTLSGTIGGPGAFSFAGPGSLTLMGTNTYTGATNLNGGTLAISSDSQINNGIGGVNFNGGTLQLNGYSSSLLFHNGAQLGAAAGVSSGLFSNNAISGPRAFTFVGPGTLGLGVSNTYTGGTNLDGGTLLIGTDSNINDGIGGINFNGGTLEFGRYTSNLNFPHGATLGASAPAALAGAVTGGTLVYNGPSVLTLTGRNNCPVVINAGVLVLGNATALNQSVTVNAGGEFELNGFSPTITGLSGNGTVDNTSAVDAVLSFGGSGVSTFSGTITNSNGLLGLDMNGSGTQVLTGSSTFIGGTTLSEGILAITSDAAINGGGANFEGGALQLDNYTSTMSFGGQTVILGAAAGAPSVLVGTITDATMHGALVFGGPGTLVLAPKGSNNYSGGTILNAGTLALNSPSAIGAGPFTINGGAIDSTNGTTLTTSNAESWNGFFSFVGTTNLNLGPNTVTLSTTPTVTIEQNTLTVPGVISGAGGLNLLGLGTLALSAANTFAGNVTLEGSATPVLNSFQAGQSFVGGPTLVLDFSATGAPTSNILYHNKPPTILILAGGDVLIKSSTSGSSVSQAFGSTVIEGGYSTIQLSGSDPVTLSLGGIMTGTGTVTSNNGVVNLMGLASNMVVTTTNGNTNGILAPGGQASVIVGGTSWATVSGTNAVGLPTASYTFDSATLGASTSNIDFSGPSSVALSASTTINTLRFNNPINDSITTVGANTLTIAAGSILQTANVGSASNVIAGGSLRGSAGGALRLLQFDAGDTLTINSSIVDNGANSQLELYGSGTVILGEPNFYGGATWIYGGALEVSSNGNLGATVIPPGDLTANNAVNIDGGILEATASFALNNGAGNGSDRQIGLGPQGGTFDVTSTNTLTITGIVSGFGLTKIDSGTLALAAAGNTFTGPTEVDGGILNVATLANGGSPSSLGASSNVASNLILSLGTLQYTGSPAESTDRLFTVGGPKGNAATLDASGSGAVSFTNPGPIAFGSSSPETLNLTGSGNGSLVAAIGNPGSTSQTSLNKTGAGTWTLAGANTYGGATDVEAGSLVMGAASALPVNSALTIGAGAVLQIAPGAGGQVTSAPLIVAGSLDITNNYLVVNYSGDSDPVAIIRSYLVSGYNGGTWQGAGINSSAAAQDTSIYSVGYTDGDNSTDSDNTGIVGPLIFIKYTVAGDVTLDGAVNMADLLIVENDFGMTGADWAEGDVNYDGVVDEADLVIVLANYGDPLSSINLADFSLPARAEIKLGMAEISGTNVVPEPGTAALALGAAGLLARRRRR
jgi:fibronectin-binding autotransporter adhesin